MTVAPSRADAPAVATALPRITDARLAPIADRVLAGERLSAEDGLALFQTPDILTVGRLADGVRARLCGDAVFYNVNRHINATNLCVAGCKFCAFARREGEDGGWLKSWDEIEGTMRGLSPRVTEIHTVNGHHPTLPLEWYEEYLQRMHAVRPDVHLKAFTAAEIFFFHEISGLPVETVLRRLRAAGLGSLSGGGCEVLVERVHRKMFPGKCGAEEWLSVHAMAHRLGIPTTATILFNHIETVEERVTHLVRLRELQDAAPGFTAFVPLPFHPDNTYFARRWRPATGYAELRMIAVSRLMLDNFPHVKAYWLTLGTEVAELALAVGASDIDGTVEEEHIMHMAGSDAPQMVSEAGLRDMIARAGRVPVERDTIYRAVRATELAGARVPLRTPDDLDERGDLPEALRAALRVAWESEPPRRSAA
ncbi:MAG TPA: aminofutalosine synthase MqnE [Candidatus Dormibacteraeota bacterium]|nr:aminofutalosine synthase MqnE [Candidatus Dormibacteraeota bacterium]